MWRPFRKKEKTSIPELQEYYENERKVSNSRAWFAAFITLLIAVLVIVAIFWGARWLVRTYRDRNNDDQPTNVTQTESQSSSTNTENQPATPAPESSSQGSSSSQQGSSSNQSTNTQPPSTSTTEPTTGTTSQAPSNSGQSSTSASSTPNTGPGEVGKLIIGTVILSSSAHYINTRRKLKQNK